MAGIYLHIPFCHKACNYCNFHFSTSLKLVDPVLQAMKAEIKARQNYLPAGTPIKTVYFGGGTPSLLNRAQLDELLAALRTTYVIDTGAELSLEANPEDITNSKLREWKQAGFNRLSIGIQGFQDKHLAFMNRNHSAKAAREAVLKAQSEGFDNISIDLIYGIPGMSAQEWDHNLRAVVELGIPHVSAYCLTVETGTALHHQVKTGAVKPAEDEVAANQFQRMRTYFEAAGIRQYEVSNFARPGWESRHNSAYWQGKSYLGIGPSAHSYNGYIRRWNIANNARYVKAVSAGEPYWEEEKLSQSDRWNESIMTGLRTIQGVEDDGLRALFGFGLSDRFPALVEKYQSAGLLQNQDRIWSLTAHGLMQADGIASDFFIFDDDGN